MFCETKFHFYPHIILLRPYCRMQFEFSVLVSIINRNCTFTIHSGDSSLLLFFLLLNHESLVVSLALQANISDLYYAVELSCTFLAFGKSRFEMFQCWRPRSFAFLYKIKFSNHVRLIRHGLYMTGSVCVSVCVCVFFMKEHDFEILTTTICTSWIASLVRLDVSNILPFSFRIEQWAFQHSNTKHPWVFLFSIVTKVTTTTSNVSRHFDPW